jgi:hypothetical protein
MKLEPVRPPTGRVREPFAAGNYFFVESAVRLRLCVSQDRPVGSLPVALGLQLGREIRCRR